MPWVWQEDEYEGDWQPMPDGSGWLYDANFHTPENPGALRRGISVSDWAALYQKRT